MGAVPKLANTDKKRLLPSYNHAQRAAKVCPSLSATVMAWVEGDYSAEFPLQSAPPSQVVKRYVIQGHMRSSKKGMIILHVKMEVYNHSHLLPVAHNFAVTTSGPWHWEVGFC